MDKHARRFGDASCDRPDGGGRDGNGSSAQTYTFMDAIDSWNEDCRDGMFRRTIAERDQWIPFTVRTETILRKRGAAVQATFHENEHGVLDGDPTVPGLYLSVGVTPEDVRLRLYHRLELDEFLK